MQLVNCTNHNINLIDPSKKGNEEILDIPPSGIIARVVLSEETLEPLKITEAIQVPIVTTKLGKLINLPEPKSGTKYIVSMMVLQQAKKLGRTDLLCPNVMRDTHGVVLGCVGFIT
jgi:hypothetical protein